MDDENGESLVKRPNKYKKRKVPSSISEPELRYGIKHIARNLAPVVTDLITASNIDVYSDFPGGNFDRVFLFDALLATNHPKIVEAIEQARRELGLSKLMEIRKEEDEYSDCYIVSLVGTDKRATEICKEQVDIIFAGVGRNLPRDDWYRPLAYWILTGTITVPLMSTPPVELLPCIPDPIPDRLKNLPVLVIKEQIKGAGLERIFSYLRTGKSKISKFTEHLPIPPFKRSDADLSNLAIGLLARKPLPPGVENLSEWFDKKYKDDNYYFGEKCEPTYAEIAKLKIKAKIYLDKLYPLRTSS